MAVSRAGAKLEAAMDHFGLAAALDGARAVDVGASTGGFTEVMLAHGAPPCWPSTWGTISCTRPCGRTRA